MTLFLAFSEAMPWMMNLIPNTALPERPMIFHALISSGLNSKPRNWLASRLVTIGIFRLIMNVDGSCPVWAGDQKKEVVGAPLAVLTG
jgi:hypothetical protein